MRSIRNQPFCWQEKTILRLLRKKYSKSNLVKLRCLYGAITEIASDFNQQDIRYYSKTIQTYSGLPLEWIPKGLKVLRDIGIIKIISDKENGRFKGKHLEFITKELKELSKESIEKLALLPKRLRSPKEKINNLISSSMSTSLKTNKKGKYWENLVNYNLSDLKKHLEKQFQKGMSWDNYGKWHIDHKIPKIAFDIRTEGDIAFLQCWSLSNLQPLWAKDNIKKGGKIFNTVNSNTVNGGTDTSEHNTLNTSTSIIDNNNTNNNSNKSLASITSTSKDNNRCIGDIKKQQKQQYGKFSNVLLTEDDYKKLEDEVDDIDKWIKKLDRGIEQKGYTYRSHYATILDWYERECEKENKEVGESDKYLKTTSRLKKDVKFKKAVEESKKSIAKMLRGKNK